MPGAASEDPADALVAAAQEILLQRGLMDEDDLLDALEAAGADLDPAFERPLSDVLDDHREPVHVLADGRLAWIPSVLAGRIFTHRLTAAEADHDVIPWSADLAALSLLIDGEGFDQLADGSPISEAFAELGEDLRGAPESVDPGGGVLLLPPGKFAELGVGAGDLVGLRLTPQGFKIEKVADVTPTGAGAALTAALEDIPDRPESLDTVVWSICADDDGLFRQPCAPLSEILAPTNCLSAMGSSRLAASTSRLPRYQSNPVHQRTVRIERRRSAGRAGGSPPVRPHSEDAGRGEHRRCRPPGRGDHAVCHAEPGQPGATTPASDRTTMGMALTLLAEPIVTAAVLDQIGNENEREATALRFFAESLEPMVRARRALRCGGCGPRL